MTGIALDQLSLKGCPCARLISVAKLQKSVQPVQADSAESRAARWLSVLRGNPRRDLLHRRIERLPRDVDRCRQEVGERQSRQSTRTSRWATSSLSLIA